MIVNNAEVRDISVKINLVDVLGLETVIAACDYNWSKMEEIRQRPELAKWGVYTPEWYQAAGPEYDDWLTKWSDLESELNEFGYEWTVSGYKARQGEDK